MNERPPSGPALALTLLAGVLFALSAWHFAPHQGDDGFIFLRYAQRLASGHGLGFTDGVAPVEGYSSPLWLLLLTGPAALGVDLVVAVKVLSALSVGALLAGVWILVRQLGGSARPTGSSLKESRARAGTRSCGPRAASVSWQPRPAVVRALSMRRDVVCQL